jgi:CHASE3 domain sensor protein
MARWEITIQGKAIRKASVEKLAAKLKEEFAGASISVSDATLPESRSERFSHAMDLVSDAKSHVEELRDELQDWYDNLPENLQQGSKAEEIQEAIDALDSVVSDLDNCEGADVSFPGMY